MEDWQQRVVIEKEELDGKIHRLQVFLNTIPGSAIDELLPMQLRSMELYSWILSKRIATF